MSKIMLIDRQVIQILSRKSQLNQDQIKKIMEIFSLSILELNHRQNIQQKLGKINLQDVRRASRQVEHQSRQRDLKLQEQMQGTVQQIKKDLRLHYSKEQERIKQQFQKMQNSIQNMKLEINTIREDKSRSQQHQTIDQIEMLKQEIKKVIISIEGNNKNGGNRHKIQKMTQELKNKQQKEKKSNSSNSKREQNEKEEKKQNKEQEQEQEKRRKQEQEQKRTKQQIQTIENITGYTWQSLQQDTTLNLTNKGLNGLLQSFGLLTQLKQLFIYRNPLGHFPECILQLHNLTRLYMQRTEIEQLPDNFGQKLSNLQQLRIHSNRLRRLPSSFGKLQKLQRLYLTVEPDSEFGLSQIPLSPNLNYLRIHLKKETTQEEKEQFESKCKTIKDFKWYDFDKNQPQ